MGRPKKPGGARSHTVTIRVDAAEREVLRQAAAIERRDVSDWVRLLALDTATKLIGRAEQKAAKRTG